jgi:DNA-binding transcriptional LysR family regulator
MVRGVEMSHLRYFVTVAEELNFSRAARRLHMAASPLSQRIKDLERELGTELFERTTHRVALTQAGAALLPLARDVVERFAALPWRLRQAVSAAHRTALMGMSPALHPRLRELVGELAERCRDRVELKRWPGGSTELAGAVHDGSLDLALVHLPVTDAELEVTEVMAERLGALVPADQFAGRASVRLSDLVDLAYAAAPLALTQKYFEQLDADLDAAGIRKRVRLQHADFGGIAELIASGLAFSVSALDRESPMQTYRLDNSVVLPFEDFHPVLVTGLIWRADRARDGDLADLAAQARSVFARRLTA